MTRRPTFPLPLELLDMIFTWARLEPRKETADFGTLVASSSVCKAWRAPAQALLFRDVPISLCHNRRSLLIRSLSECPDLGRHIRSFGMEITSPPVPWGRDPPPEEESLKRYRRRVADFIAILTYAPNLTRVSIDIDGEFDTADISKLVSLNLRHVEVLNWEGRPTSSVLYLLLTLWPSIRHLRVDNLYFDPLPEDRRPPSLHSLCVRDELSEGFMTWLLPTDDMGPLRELHIESPLPSYRIFKDIQAHTPTLHILTVENIPPQSILDALTVLKEFAFREPPRSPFHLPRSVERVGFHPKKDHQRRLQPYLDNQPIGRREKGDGDSRSIDETTGYLTKALTDLPNLAIVSTTRQTPKKIQASLEEFCREAKVEFSVYDRTVVYSPQNKEKGVLKPSTDRVALASRIKTKFALVPKMESMTLDLETDVSPAPRPHYDVPTWGSLALDARKNKSLLYFGFALRLGFLVLLLTTLFLTVDD
ncbi:hypothetical protein B0F90DRAFT_1816955 [Multifurca ochricompacta]|uniref:F-box domain-containing protein n=1 Tax=Multifurca ochricompacta TaxID=376703 RepID=A0AAD4M6X9_9AGAM|nr:hypothetical protein B0F90DRAFT_1816955 [Multifurca ochricompacta]